MSENDTKPKGDPKYTNEDKVSILVHEMLHDLIVILNTQPREIGAMAMIELLVCHSPFKEKEELLDYISRVWDEFSKVDKDDK